jgi:YD repeat-containing protein
LDEQFVGEFGEQRFHTIYDPFGRPTKATESGTDTLVTTTVYDGAGRVYQRYNPAKSASASSTDGATTFTLDALGRVTKATNPDNSFVATVYGVQTSQTSTVRTITVTDEAGVSRTMQYDGLGRMVAATEASGSTSYSYDALDNLTGVTQGSQTRSFRYDSLKRLKEAHNPETTDQTHDQSLQFITYTYDKAGNLASRSDGRFTICHGSIVSGKCDGLGYDALNRLILVTYSDPNTPTVTHCYDGLTVSATACAGAAGRHEGIVRVRLLS